MEIWHRIGINSKEDETFFKTIQKLGIQYKTLPPPPGMSMGVYFDITESHADWPVVSELIAKYGASNMNETFFDDEEILARYDLAESSGLGKCLNLWPSYRYNPLSPPTHIKPSSSWVMALKLGVLSPSFAEKFL